MDKLIIFDCDGVLVDSEIIANRMDAEFLTPTLGTL
jgi:beta-phosphoglucomutase-like phosphatase (HAD superfamily)